MKLSYPQMVQYLQLIADKFNPLEEHLNPFSLTEGAMGYSGGYGKMYRGVEGGTDRVAAIRPSRGGGDMGSGTYFTPSKQIAESYGGGPTARVSNGTRVVHEYDMPKLPGENIAYIRGGTKIGENVQVVDGKGQVIYDGPWKSQLIDSALSKHPQIKAVLGTPDSIGNNQISIRDPSILGVK